jgi:hypothetical protein
MVLRGDVLTEVMPGGLLHGMWVRADQEVLVAQVEVIPWSEAVAMLPAENTA